MPRFDPQLLANDCGGNWRALPVAPVAGFAIDSRVLQPGEMFVALRTERRDGHDFLDAAAARGASAALVSRVAEHSVLPQLVVKDTLAALHALTRAHRERFAGRVVAVTGSAGKTSTKDLLAVLLGNARDVLATEGNLNNHLGVPLTLLRIDPTRHRCAVVEAGISAAGEMDVIAELAAPDVAMITNVGPAHLDGLGSIAEVAKEKSRLAAHRRAGGVAVFPADCLAHDSFRAVTAPTIVIVPVGTKTPDIPVMADVVPYVVRQDGVVTRLCLTWKGTLEEFDLRRVTGGMAANAVLALTVALHLGVKADVLRGRLPRWRPAALRGEVRRSGERLVYLDCYNANPLSMADALDGFVGLAPANVPRLFVVGCMEELGSEAAALHRALGERWPLRAQDRLIVFGACANDLALGASSVAPAAEILVNPEREFAARLLREFRGAIFLKGSRRHALETLLGESSHAPATSAKHREGVAA